MNNTDIASLTNEAIRLAISESKGKPLAAAAIASFAARIQNLSGSEGVAAAYMANARRAVAMEAGGNLYFCRMVREATTFA